MTYKKAAEDAVSCQDGCNSSGIARSLVQAIDAIREHDGAGTREINKHPIVFMFLYKLMALNGHEPLNLWDEYSNAERACKAIVAAEEIAEISAGLNAEAK